MKQLRCILIDHECNNLDLFSKALQRNCPQLSVVGMETDAELGLKLIAELQPDIVFLEINMPKLSGFELLKKLEHVNLEVIFMSANSEYAIEAFEYHAIAFLSKPIMDEKLIIAVHNVEERIHEKNTARDIFLLFESRLKLSEERKVPLSTLTGMIFINEDDIIYCESQGCYTNFYTLQGQKLMVCRQLGEYEKLLPEGSFVRIHDKYLINLKYVDEYVKGRGGEIKLNHVTKLPVSANRKENLMARFDRWLKR